jgi:hypothetical protein
MKLTHTVAALALSSAFTLSACGEKEETTGTAESAVTPAEAVEEIGAVRIGLDRAVKQLRGGDRNAAEGTVAETYLQHFEKVEGPLEEVDHELNEELEEAINTELRQEIKSGAKVAVVVKLVRDIKADLATAEAKLEQS